MREFLLSGILSQVSEINNGDDSLTYESGKYIEINVIIPPAGGGLEG